MKKIKILLFVGMLGVCLFKTYASSPALISKPDSLVDELLLRNYAEEQLHMPPSQYATLTTKQKASLFSVGGWLRGILNFVTGDDWGQYREPGHRDEGPYMTFQYNMQNQPHNYYFENQI